MSAEIAHEEEDACMCQGKVPAEARIDFQVQVTDPKTQKLKWKTVLRYHKHCPDHGIVKESDATRP